MCMAVPWGAAQPSPAQMRKVEGEQRLLSLLYFGFRAFGPNLAWG